MLRGIPEDEGPVLTTKSNNDETLECGHDSTGTLSARLSYVLDGHRWPSYKQTKKNAEMGAQSFNVSTLLHLQIQCSDLIYMPDVVLVKIKGTR